jgi:hypothetical protein
VAQGSEIVHSPVAKDAGITCIEIRVIKRAAHNFQLAGNGIDHRCGDIAFLLKRAFRYTDEQDFSALIGSSSGIEGTEDLKIRPRWLYVLW